MTQTGGAVAEISERQGIVPHTTALQKDPQEQYWYAVHTSPRHEKRVEQLLRNKDFATFLPLISAIHQWSDRRRLVSAPLFPGYLFVRTTPIQSARVSVLRTRGVITLVGATGKGTPLPDQQIEAVRNVIESGAYCSPYPFLKTGQRVRISGGSLHGIEGILVAKNRDQSVVISLDLIQNSLAVQVTGYRLEPV